MSTNTRPLAVDARRALPLLAEVLLLLLGGGLIAASRKYLDLSLGIPGHTGILWMALLVGGKLIVRRDGAGLAMGVSAALWGIPLGLGNSPVYNLALYSLVGAVVDLATRMPGVRLAHPFWAAVAGALAHLTKLAFITAYAMSLGLYRHFWEIGLALSGGYHLLFGALGGLSAVVVFELVRRRNVRRERSPR